MRPTHRPTGLIFLVLVMVATASLVAPALAGDTVTITGQILSVYPPVAEFTGSPTSGYAPLAVQFTDQSTNNPTAWKWEYQKAGTHTWTQFSTAQSPSYTFAAVGYYNIRLMATNSAGIDTTTKYFYIRVGHTGPAFAYFTGTPKSGPKPLTVHFTDRSFGNIDTWDWDFQNDGTYDSTLKNPSFTYPEKGNYSVRLRISNALMSNTIVRYNYVNVK
jgi:PKD repeat protein